MVDRLTQTDAASLVRHCLEQGVVVPGRHFRQALKDEGLDMLDARHVLENGRIYNEPELHVKTGEWNYRIEGQIPEGRCLGIVFSFKEVDSVFLITVFAIKRLA
jgi:hypothetical protein